MRVTAARYEKSTSQGFTLVEVLVGMFLMAVVFTSAFGAYFLGMRLIEDAREEMRASQIIQSEVERLRTKNWEQLDQMKAFAYFESQGTFTKQYAKDYLAYRYILNINASRQKLVVVVVQWTDSRGQTKSELFNTIITKDGLNDYYYRKV